MIEVLEMQIFCCVVLNGMLFTCLLAITSAMKARSLFEMGTSFIVGGGFGSGREGGSDYTPKKGTDEFVYLCGIHVRVKR